MYGVTDSSLPRKPQSSRAWLAGWPVMSAGGGLLCDRSALALGVGHAFVQNLRGDHLPVDSPPDLLTQGKRRERPMASSFTTVSTTSSVNISDGQAVISVNGRVWRVDAKDAASVRVVSDGTNTDIEITDQYGRTRRVHREE